MALFNINRFHLFAMTFWLLAKFLTAQMMFPIFSNYVPKWRCTATQKFGNNCTLYEECANGVEFENNYFQSAALEYGWICGSAIYWRTFYAQLQFFGMIVGTLIFGSFSDAFGRRTAAIVDVVIATVVFLFSGLAPNWQLLLVSRFLIGVSAGGSISIMTLCNELVLPDQRVALRGFFNWGTIRLGLTLICYFLPAWRHATLAFVPICVIMLLMVIFVLPESPTWLHKKGRIEQMHKAEKWIAKFGKVEYVKSEVADEVEKEGTLLDLLKNPTLFKRLAVLWFMFFTSAMCSYGNDFNSSSISGNLFLNQALFSIFLAASEFPLAFVDSKFSNFSRRKLHQGSQLLVCLCFLLLIFLMVMNENSPWILVVNVLGTLSIEYTWDANFLCSNEAMPTKVRASAAGSCWLVSRFGGILAPTLAHLNQYWSLSTYTAVTALGFVNLFVSWMWLVETKNVSLDTVKLDDKLPEEEARLATHHETVELLNGTEKKKSIRTY